MPIPRRKIEKTLFRIYVEDFLHFVLHKVLKFPEPEKRFNRARIGNGKAKNSLRIESNQDNHLSGCLSEEDIDDLFAEEAFDNSDLDLLDDEYVYFATESSKKNGEYQDWFQKRPRIVTLTKKEENNHDIKREFEFDRRVVLKIIDSILLPLKKSDVTYGRPKIFEYQGRKCRLIYKQSRAYVDNSKSGNVRVFFKRPAIYYRRANESFCFPCEYICAVDDETCRVLKEGTEGIDLIENIRKLSAKKQEDQQ